MTIERSATIGRAGYIVVVLLLLFALCGIITIDFSLRAFIDLRSLFSVVA